MRQDRPSESSGAEPAVAPEQAVGRAIQELAAARVGRGFVPLAVLALAGSLELVLLEGFALGAATVGGALASGGAMLAYALRAVQRAFGRGHRRWMTLAAAAGLVPPAFALWILAWRGLRSLAIGGGWGTLAAGLFMTLVGGWFLHRWLKVVEIQRLAITMSGIVP